MPLLPLHLFPLHSEHSISLGWGWRRSDINGCWSALLVYSADNSNSLCPVVAPSLSLQLPSSMRVSARAVMPLSPFGFPVLCPIHSVLVAMLFLAVTVSQTAPFRPLLPSWPWPPSTALDHSSSLLVASLSFHPSLTLSSVIFLNHLSVYLNSGASHPSKMKYRTQTL